MAIVRELFAGPIGLDPCSSDWHQDRVQAKRYNTKERDCLDDAVSWASEQIYLNPPYSAPRPYIHRLINAVKNERAEAVLLVTSSNASSWYQDALGADWRVCLLNRRIQHCHPDPARNAKQANRYHQSIFYGGPHPMRFAAIFGVAHGLGHIR